MKTDENALPVLLKNLITNEEKGFLANPEDLTLSVSSEYNEPNILGSGNAPLGYKRTKNQVYTLRFFLSAEYITTRGRTNKTNALRALADWRAFYLSLMYPHKNEGDKFVSGEPPKVRFTWPGLVSMTCRILQQEWKFQFFQLDMQSVFEVGSMTLKADHGYPIWSDEMRLTGLDIEL